MAPSKSEWFNILKIVGPVVMAMTGLPAILIPVVVAGIAKAEESMKPGVEKKKIALEMVSLGIQGINIGAKRTVINEMDAVSAVSQSIETTLSVIKLVQGTAHVRLPDPLPKDDV